MYRKITVDSKFPSKFTMEINFEHQGKELKIFVV